jgi:hypothetical protein
MVVTPFDANTVCLTVGELARYEYVAVLVPSETVASLEAAS